MWDIEYRLTFKLQDTRNSFVSTLLWDSFSQYTHMGWDRNSSVSVHSYGTGQDSFSHTGLLQSVYTPMGWERTSSVIRDFFSQYTLLWDGKGLLQLVYADGKGLPQLVHSYGMDFFSQYTLLWDGKGLLQLVYTRMGWAGLLQSGWERTSSVSIHSYGMGKDFLS